MAHQHDHDHDHHRHATDTSSVRVAFFLNFGFTIVELIGGVLTNSVAIISDAVHDLGDTMALGLAWYLQVLGRRGSTPTFTYGFRRFNTLGAVFTSVVLVAGSVYALTQAIPRLWNPVQPDAVGMLGLAVLGVLVNGAAVWRLKQGGNSLNEETVSLHLLEDVLGWVAVLIGAAVMYFVDAPWIDPVLSILIALYVLSNVWRSLRKAAMIMLQAKPDDLDADALQARVETVAGAGRVSHLHVWSLDGEYHLASVDVRVPSTTTAGELTILRTKLRAAFQAGGVEHVTVEFVTKEEVSEAGARGATTCDEIDAAAMLAPDAHAGHAH